MPKTLLIIGSGALACLFAARISRGGQSVYLTDNWVKGMEAIRKKGVWLVEGNQTTTHEVTVLDRSNSILQFSHTLILIKAYQTSEAVQSVRNSISEDGTLLTLQNGLTVRGKIVEILGEERVLSGITTCAAQTVTPGVVCHNGGNTIRIGSHPFAKDYQKIFTNAGFDVFVEPKIKEMIWEKALLNSAINPMGALLGLTNGELKNNPDALGL
ncbi:MAG: 2-dehydropantoate 2-reductase, partial [Leptolinea sp.]